jgi:Flp pilus assembly protein TadB
MKLPTLFNKTPKYKRFDYSPRHYDPLEEERKEREERIRRELSLGKENKDERTDDDIHGYRTRISGSFRTAKKTANVQRDPSANMVRLFILVLLVIGVLAYIEYGQVALYGVAIVFIPFYFFLKFRKFRR